MRNRISQKKRDLFLLRLRGVLVRGSCVFGGGYLLVRRASRRSSQVEPVVDVRRAARRMSRHGVVVKGQLRFGYRERRCDGAGDPGRFASHLGFEHEEGRFKIERAQTAEILVGGRDRRVLERSPVSLVASSEIGNGNSSVAEEITKTSSRTKFCRV